MWIRWIRIRIHNTAGVYSRHLSKIQNGRHKQRSGQHTLAHQKNIQKKFMDTLISTLLVISRSERLFDPRAVSYLCNTLQHFPTCTGYRTVPTASSLFFTTRIRRKVKRESRLHILRSTKKFRIHNLNLNTDRIWIRPKYPIH
jgi:hypothetical protein